MATPDILDIATNFKFVPLKQHRHAVEWHYNILLPLFGELLCNSTNRRIHLFLYKMVESLWRHILHHELNVIAFLNADNISIETHHLLHQTDTAVRPLQTLWIYIHKALCVRFQ